MSTTEFRDGVYEEKILDPGWIALSEILSSVGEIGNLQGALCLARLHGGPVVRTSLDAVSASTNKDFPSAVRADVHFVPKLPGEIADCHEGFAVPTEAMAEIQGDYIRSPFKPYVGQAVHTADRVSLSELKPIEGLHSGVQYEFTVDSTCESVYGQKISVLEGVFTPPASFEILWREAPGVRVAVTGAARAELTIYGHREGAHGGSMVLATTEAGGAWVGASYLRDGVYRVTAVGGGWVSREPSPRFSVSGGSPSPDTVYVEVERAIAATVEVAGPGMAGEYGVYYWKDPEGWEPCPTNERGDHPCLVSVDVGSIRFLDLIGSIEVLCVFPDSVVARMLTVVPGQDYEIRVPRAERVLLAEALRVVKESHHRFPEVKRGFLDVLVGDADGRPLWVAVKYVNLSLDGALEKSAWVLPVREGATYRLRMFAPGGGKRHVTRFVAN